MHKITYLTAAILLSISTASFSAERSPQSEEATPTSVRNLFDLPTSVTKLNLSEIQVVNDEIATYYPDRVSTSVLVDQARHIDQKDRSRITAIEIKSSPDLLGNSGFKHIVESFLPLFPSLEVVQFLCDGIEENNEEILLHLLKEPTLKFVNIVDNRLAKQVIHDIGNGMNPEDKKRICSKVIVLPKSEIKNLPSDHPEWQDTHRRFYDQQVVH